MVVPAKTMFDPLRFEEEFALPVGEIPLDPMWYEMVEADASDFVQIILDVARSVGIHDHAAFGVVSAEVMAKQLDNVRNSNDLVASGPYLFRSHTREGIKNELLEALRNSHEHGAIKALFERVSAELETA